jgi:sugar/nucleoside kinase (ribokinase family)
MCVRLTPDVFLETAQRATYLFANEEEALTLAATRDVGSALEFLASHFGEVVITRGVNGALAAHGRERVDAAALDVVALDTTGAGDAATGAYLGARLRGEAMENALPSAMVAGARAVEALGAR